MKKSILLLMLALASLPAGAVATVDRNYIEQPKHGLAIEARTTLNQSTLKMETTYEIYDQSIDLITESKNGFSTSVGLWLGYRGYGFGYSKEVGHTTGSTFSFGDISMAGVKLIDYETVDDRLDDPIRVRTLFLDGYYLFNGKHFSYAAAYDNSLIQRHSAGSVVVGGMYCHSRSDYSNDSNWELSWLMKGVGKVKFTQASIGAGYAYNLVPGRGWLISRPRRLE